MAKNKSLTMAQIDILRSAFANSENVCLTDSIFKKAGLKEKYSGHFEAMVFLSKIYPQCYKHSSDALKKNSNFIMEIMKESDVSKEQLNKSPSYFLDLLLSDTLDKHFTINTDFYKPTYFSSYSFHAFQSNIIYHCLKTNNLNKILENPKLEHIVALLSFAPYRQYVAGISISGLKISQFQKLTTALNKCMKRDGTTFRDIVDNPKLTNIISLFLANLELGNRNKDKNDKHYIPNVKDLKYFMKGLSGKDIEDIQSKNIGGADTLVSSILYIVPKRQSLNHRRV